MKKVQRSQSSYRVCKTLEAEDDRDKHPQWVSNVSKGNVKKVGKRVNLAVSSDESNSMFQSISERVLQIDTEDKSDIKSQHMVDASEQRCLRGKENVYNQSNMDYKKEPASRVYNYNYSQWYYKNEIEELRKQLSFKDKELEQFRNLYSSKNNELEGMSEEISSRIEKEHLEKNLYIKQINNRNIEIKKLKECHELHLAEKETSKVLISQQEKEIEALKNKNAHLEQYKLKIESFMLQNRSSSQMLETIESELHKMKEQNQQKDEVIRSNKEIIGTLEDKINHYEIGIKQLEQAVMEFQENSATKQRLLEEKEKEIEEWKESYLETKIDAERLPELEHKLKCSEATVTELHEKYNQSSAKCEKLKIEAIKFDKSALKITELEKEVMRQKRQLREKDEKIQVYQHKQVSYKEFYTNFNSIKQEKDELYLKVQDKQKEIKNQINENQLLSVKNSNIEEQVKDLEETNRRLSEKKDNIEAIHKQNSRLSNALVEKLNEIQKYQQRINCLENKISNLTNENSKNKALLEAKDESIHCLENQSEILKDKWEKEIAFRMTLEERNTKINQEFLNVKSNITSILTEKSKMEQELQEVTQQYQESQQQSSEKLAILETCKRQSHAKLEEVQSKLASLTQEVIMLKELVTQLESKGTQHSLKLEEFEAYIDQLQQQLQAAKHSNQLMTKEAEKIREIAGHMLTNAL